jgi:hypothetical protein
MYLVVAVVVSVLRSSPVLLLTIRLQNEITENLRNNHEPGTKNSNQVANEWCRQGVTKTR